jgi:PhnB protein
MADVQPISDRYPRVTPILTVAGAAEAIDFYTEILGASQRGDRMISPDGKVRHAELELGGSVIIIADEFPDFGSLGPLSVGGASVTLRVYVEDVDSVYKAALDAGATGIRAVQTQFYGDRSGQFEDPFGHRWNVASHVEDVTPEEMERRAATAMSGG